MTDRQTYQDVSTPIAGLLPWQSYLLAFVVGIFAFRHQAPAVIALGVLFVTDISLRGWNLRLPLLAFALCAVFGFAYASQRAPEPVTVPEWIEEKTVVQVRAVVDRAEPRMGGRFRMVMRDVECVVNGTVTRLPGKVTWYWSRADFAPLPGQTFAAPMRVVPVRSFGNPGGWDYAWYWQRQGVNWRGWLKGMPQWGAGPDAALSAMKAALRKKVARLVPDTPGGGMVRALVTGDRSGLTRDMRQATQRAGLAHTLALSGLHVGFVAAMGVGVAWLLSLVCPPLLLIIPRQKLAVLLAAPLVIGYAWLGQPSQSLLRATIMFAFWGFFLLQGRTRVLLDGLFFALLVIVLFSPFSVFDLSLQMSVLAVGGIGVLFPKVRPLLYLGGSWPVRLIGWLGGVLAVSVCANLALLPLIAWTFGVWTPNILFNTVWLPVLGFVVMPLGLSGVLLSSVPGAAPAAQTLLGWASTVMGWLIDMLQLASAQGMTPVFSVLRPIWPEMFGGGLLLLAAVVAWANRRVCVGLAALGFLLLVSPHLAVMIQDARNEVSMTLIDVGQGQSILVSTPGGGRWLVDGSGGSRNFDRGEAVVAPFLTHGRPPRLDGVFMSHPDADHSYGLPFILSRFDVDTFYTNGSLPRRGTRTGELMRTVLEEWGKEPTVLRAGDAVSLGPKTRIEVVHPAEDFRSRRANEKSLVLRLVHNGRSLALLPGDIERGAINALLSAAPPVRAEVLVLPHHGSKSSCSPALYEAVSPEVVVCSNGYLNRYGFPHPCVAETLALPVHTTAQHGAITVSWSSEGVRDMRFFRNN